MSGHDIQHIETREVGGVLYVNDADRVESCTAMAEYADGRLELVDWAKENDLPFWWAPPAATRRGAVAAA